jgi:hypothetical protein
VKTIVYVIMILLAAAVIISVAVPFGAAADSGKPEERAASYSVRERAE